ncbi:MAG: lipoyl domain-containing protein [Candidatus Binatia bacterium]
MTAPDVHPILVPREIVNADSVFVVRWLVGEGDLVQPGTTVCEVETSKAVLNVEADQAGHLRRRAGEGDEVPIGGVLGYLTAAADTALPDAGLSDAAPAAVVAAVQISAKARQKMEELGLDPALFAGRGAVKEKDIEMAAQVHAAAAIATRGLSRRAARRHRGRAVLDVDGRTSVAGAIARLDYLGHRRRLLNWWSPATWPGTARRHGLVDRR